MPVVQSPVVNVNSGLSDAYGELGQGSGALLAALIQAYRRQTPGAHQFATPDAPPSLKFPGGQSIPSSPQEIAAIQSAGGVPSRTGETVPFRTGLGSLLPGGQGVKYQSSPMMLPENIARMASVAAIQKAPYELGKLQAETTALLNKPEKESKEQKRKNLIDSTKIREEFLNRPEVKEYVEINTQVRSMDSLLKKAKSGSVENKVALDQALVTMYNKLTDPQSVVRESEYARTAANLPLTNRFAGALQKLEQGGAGLTDSDREALIWGAKVIADERGRTFNETRQGYVDLAEEYEIGESLITRGLTPHQDYNQAQSEAPASSPAAQSILSRYRGTPTR